MKVIAVLLMLVLATSMVQGESQILVNGIFDFIMNNIRRNSDELERYRVVPIPDLVKRYGLELFGVMNVTASLVATKGTLTDLTSLHRVGDVTMTTRGHSAFFTASVALETMKVLFKKYTLQAGLIRHSGDKLEVNARTNSFDASLFARFDGTRCVIKLRSIKIRQFRDVDVHLTGFSIFNPIGNQIANWIIVVFNDYIKEIAENYAKSMVNHAVEDTSVCKLIFGNAISGIVGNADDSDNYDE